MIPIKLHKYAILEMRLKYKLGQNNVQLELFSNKFVIHVKNVFGVASYSYNYDVDLSAVYNDVMRDYIVK